MHFSGRSCYIFALHKVTHSNRVRPGSNQEMGRTIESSGNEPSVMRTLSHLGFLDVEVSFHRRGAEHAEFLKTVLDQSSRHRSA